MDSDDQILVVGDGTNILFAAPPKRTVALMRIKGIEILRQSSHSVSVRVGAGVVWDELVRWSTTNGFWGLENLALIPGRCGAAPVQNIGAYGAQLSDVLCSVRAWTARDHEIVELSADSLDLRYRNSIMRSSPGEYVVTALELTLSLEATARLDYPGLAEALATHNSPSSAEVADAVSTIRRQKLPDPAELGNAGSFFKNPVVSTQRWQELRQEAPSLIGFDSGDGNVKLGAARMIELCGWKGFRDGDAGVSPDHALVLVNHGSATGEQILRLAMRIQSSVADRFGLELEPEPIIYQ